MVQTGVALSHGRGTKLHLALHPPLLRICPLPHQLGLQKPNLSQSKPSSAQPPQTAPSPADVSSQAPVSIPLVQAAHETQKEKHVEKAKAFIPSHMAIQSPPTHLMGLLGVLQGWLLHGALRLQLFVFCELFGAISVSQKPHRALQTPPQPPSCKHCCIRVLAPSIYHHGQV